MRVSRLSLVLGLIMLISPLGIARPGTAHAAGCSMTQIHDPHERLAAAVERWSDLVVIGIVTDEVRVEPDYSTPNLTDLRRSDEQTTQDEYAIYRSIVRPEAVLKGDPPPGDLELPWLSEVWQCAGGPRLYPGQRVLLFLKQWPTWTNASGPQGYIWQTSLHGGQVRLRDGDALMQDYQSRTVPQYLSSADDLIRQLSAQLGSTPDAMSLAIAAAQRPEPQRPEPRTERRHEDDFPLAPVAAAAGVFVFALMFLWRRRLT